MAINSGSPIAAITGTCTIINIDPEKPALPISYPFTYAIYLAKTQGRYSTLGLAEDTSALNENVVDEDAFLAQTYLIHQERERMFFDALKKTTRGAIVCVFDITDRLQHMFFRHLDRSHPANRGRDVTKHRDAIKKLYRDMDDLVGRTMNLLNDKTVLIVMSDHGFKTFRRGVNLDMRMGGDEEGIPSAGQLLNEGTEEDLTRIFREYGEEPRARRLVREIAKCRSRNPFRTSDDLVAALYRALGRPPTIKDKARIFQAMRIAVNSELEALERVLPAIRDAMVPGAPFVVISYHSLEDRRVKNAFREWSRSCVCPPRIPLCQCRGKPLGSILTRTPIRPSEAEVDNNRRARSARLRVWRQRNL